MGEKLTLVPVTDLNVPAPATMPVPAGAANPPEAPDPPAGVPEDSVAHDPAPPADASQTPRPSPPHRQRSQPRPAAGGNDAQVRTAGLAATGIAADSDSRRKTTASALWREWGPFHRAVSFKWPLELGDEVDERLYRLREPVGLFVVAAVTRLLDESDETIRQEIARAENAKPRRRRGGA